MKAQAAALSHKSDAGGVALNLTDAEGVRAAWAAMFANVAAYDASISLDGVLIEAMGQRGLEMIVGGRNDPEWGPVALVGFGGVTAELLADVALVTPGMSGQMIEAAVLGLRQAALLTGWRGSPPLDVEALSDLVQRVISLLCAEPALIELDLNPVVVHPKGQGVVALDALMRMSD
jgi:acyl-CoA synthetase (NDP forming)